MTANKNTNWTRATLWGAALVLGAASAMVLTPFPTLPLDFLQDRHEFPVLRASDPGRVSEQPREAAPLRQLDAGAGRLELQLVENVTDPDDTRAAVPGLHALWVATGGGLLELPYDGGATRWWTTADGLPDHRLTAIAACGDGLLLGSEGGLVMVVDLEDEPRVVSVGHVVDARISDLLVVDGTVYAATWGEGIYSAAEENLDNWRSVGPEHGLRARQITSIAWLDGELLAGTAGAGLWVRGVEGKARRYVAKGGLAHDFVLDLQRRGDRVYAATPAGVSTWRRGRLQTHRGGSTIPAGLVRALGDDPREGGGILLAMAGGRVAQWGQTESELLPPTPDGLGPWNGIPSAEIRWIQPGGDALYAGTDRGIASFDGAWTWLDHDGPVSNDLTTVSARDGRVLTGSFDRGAALLDGGWQALPLPNAEVNDALLAADGTAWIATSGGLSSWDGETARTFGRMHGLASLHASAVVEDGAGLFVGTTAGVQRFDGGFSAPMGGDDAADLSHVYSLAATPDGVLAGTIGGLWSLRDHTAKRFRYETGELPDNWVNALLRNPDGTVWAGTYDAGLAIRAPDGSWAHLSEDAGLPGGWVNPGAMAALPDGSVLVGTLGAGLMRVTADGHVDRWTTADGLAGDDVTDVSVDGDTVWVATRSGLSRLAVCPSSEPCTPDLEVSDELPAS